MFVERPHAQPFLKMVGGKRVLLPEILPRLPEKIPAYYEPFVGGGAVFFALVAEKRFENRQSYLSDANEDLIQAYRTVQLDPEPVIKELKRHARLHSEEHFYAVRGHSKSSAARTIYLNRTCFNGLYRVNSKGQFNVPFGRYKNPNICDEENLRAVHDALRNTVISKIDFARAVAPAEKGDVVYCDPPYDATFTSYTKNGFDKAEQGRLRDSIELLAKRGVRVLLSNSDTPFIRKLYAGFKIEVVKAPRRVNAKSDGRGNVRELLISANL